MPTLQDDVADGNDVVSKVDLYDAHEGTQGRTPSTYLDQQERVAAEIDRAKREGRRPKDLDHPEKLPLTAGGVLVPKPYLVDSLIVAPSTAFEPDEDVKKRTTVEYKGDDAGDIDLSAAAQYAQERRAQEDALLGENGEINENATPEEKLYDKNDGKNVKNDTEESDEDRKTREALEASGKNNNNSGTADKK